MEYFAIDDSSTKRACVSRGIAEEEARLRDMLGRCTGTRRIQDWLRNSPFLGIRSSPSFVRSPEVNGCDKPFIRTFNGNCSYSHDLPVSKNCTPRCRNSPIVSTTFGSSGVLDTKRPRSTDAVSSWMPRDLFKNLCLSIVQKTSSI